MPHLSRKDTQILLSLLRKRSRSRATGDIEEERLLRRLEQRIEKSIDAVREWRADRRGPKAEELPGIPSVKDGER